MVDSLKRLLGLIIFSTGYSFIRLESTNFIRSFIKKLHPIKTNLIRVGGNKDGGYLIPDDLVGITKCFSPGVSTQSTFESDLERNGIISYLADFSVEQPTNLNGRHFFLKKFVAPYNSRIHTNFQDWIAENSNANEELILQMDIEGNEFATLLSCDSKILRRFRIMVIEFHNMELMFDRRSFVFIRDCFEKLLVDFHVVHIHPNNCGRFRRFRGIDIPSILEFTFIRKDRIRDISSVNIFPSILDKPNCAQRRDIELPKIWYVK